MSQLLLCTNEINSANVSFPTLQLRLNTRKELTLPLFRDPRRMRRKELLTEVQKFCNDNEEIMKICETLGKPELVVKVFEYLIEEGKRNPLDPYLLNDEQPEKWYLIAEQLFRQICSLKPKGSERVSMMAQAKSQLRNKTTAELISIANIQNDNISHSVDEHALELIRRFTAALILEPHFELKAQGNVGRRFSIRASVTIAGNYNGYTKLPRHLTAEGLQSQASDTRERKRKHVKMLVTSEESESPVEVDVGEIVSVSLGNDRYVRAKVTGVDLGEGENVTIRTMPVSHTEMGPHFTFELSIPEYRQAKADALLLDAEDLTL